MADDIGLITLMLLILSSVAIAAAFVLIRKTRKKLLQLSSENARLLGMIDSANEGIYVTDTQRRFLVWNKAAEKISGFSSDEVIGRFCYDNILAHTDYEGRDLCFERCPLAKVINTGDVSGPDEIYLRHKDGRIIPVEVMTAPLTDAQGKIMGAIETFNDISQRKEHDLRLSQKKMDLEAVLDNITEGVLFINNDGFIRLYNKALTKLFSIKNDLNGVQIFALQRDDPLRQGIYRADKKFPGPYCWEVKKCTEDTDCPESGSNCCRCWLLSLYGTACQNRTMPCCDCLQYKNVKSFLEKPKEIEMDGKILSVLSSFIEFRERNEIWEVTVFRDVTCEKLDAVMNLAGATAHELRQPLQILLGAVSMANNEFPGNADMKKHIDVIRESCYRMDSIIKKISAITQYRIKNYTNSAHILDIGKSSSEPGASGREKD